MNPEEIIDGLMFDFGTNLASSDEVGTEISKTNADGWGFDTSEVLEAVQIHFGVIRFTANIHFAGTHDPNRIYNGDQLEARMNGQARKKDGVWEIESHTIESIEPNID